MLQGVGALAQLFDLTAIVSKKHIAQNADDMS